MFQKTQPLKNDEQLHQRIEQASSSDIRYYSIKQDDTTILTVAESTAGTSSRLAILRSVIAVQPTSFSSSRLLTQVASLKDIYIEQLPVAVESEKYSAGLVILVHVRLKFFLLRTNNVKDQLETVFPKFLRKRSKVSAILDGASCEYALLKKGKLVRVLKRNSLPKEGITLFRNAEDLNRFIYLRKVPQSLFPDFASVRAPVSVVCGTKPDDKATLVGLSPDLTGYNLVVGVNDERRLYLTQFLLIQLQRQFKRILVIDPEANLNWLDSLNHHPNSISGPVTFYRFGVNLARNLLDIDCAKEFRPSLLSYMLLNAISIQDNNYLFRLNAFFQKEDKLSGAGKYNFTSIAENLRNEMTTQVGFNAKNKDEVASLFSSFSLYEAFNTNQCGGKLDLDLNEKEPGIFIIQFKPDHPDFVTKFALNYLLEKYRNKFDCFMTLAGEKFFIPWINPNKINFANESLLRSTSAIANKKPLFIVSREMTSINPDRSFQIKNAIFLKVSQRTKEKIIKNFAIQSAKQERYKDRDPGEIFSFLDDFGVVFRHDNPNIPFIFSLKDKNTLEQLPQLHIPPIKLESHPVELENTVIFSKRIAVQDIALSCWILKLAINSINEEHLIQKVQDRWPEEKTIQELEVLTSLLENEGYLHIERVGSVRYSSTTRGTDFLQDIRNDIDGLTYLHLTEELSVAYTNIVDRIAEADLIGIKTTITNFIGTLLEQDLMDYQQLYAYGIYLQIDDLQDEELYVDRYKELVKKVESFIDFDDSTTDDIIESPKWAKDIQVFFKHLNLPEYPTASLLSMLIRKEDLPELNHIVAADSGNTLDEIMEQAYAANRSELQKSDEETVELEDTTMDQEGEE